MRRALASLAAIGLAACGPVVVGVGDPVKLDADFKRCREENADFLLIPDFGITHHHFERDCMKNRGWTRAPEKLMGWRWVGRPAQ